MAKEAKDIEEKIKKSLKYSIIDGSFYSAMVGFGESFFAAFAVFLQATTLQLGLLGSLPQMLGSIFQLFTNRLLRLFKSRKRFVCIGALLQGSLYIPIALVYFFGTMRVFHLILFVCLYWIFGSIGGPAWSSWMGDLVNERERGVYFSRRTKICGLVTFVTFLLGGYVLQQFADGTLTQYLGFALLFVVSFFMRIVSLYYLTKKYEPKYKYVPRDYFSFIDFLKQARFRNFGSFALFLGFMNFAWYVASPFFTPYMLYDLKLDYMTFTIVNAVQIIVKYLAMPVWGKAADKFGTKKVLTLASFLMPATPILWIFATDFWYLVFIQVYSGLVWAGFDIASFNFAFDSTSPQKRALCLSYYNVFNGVTLFLGAMFGSFVIKYNNAFWSKYYLVFILSCILRYVASVLFIPKLKEVRQVEHTSYKQLMIYLFSSSPTGDIFHRIFSFENKVAGTIRKGENKIFCMLKKQKNKNR